jgi:hypothetical protein
MTAGEWLHEKDFFNHSLKSTNFAPNKLIAGFL